MLGVISGSVGRASTVDGQIPDGNLNVACDVDHAGTVGGSFRNSHILRGDFVLVTVQSDALADVQKSLVVVLVCAVQLHVLQQGDHIAVLSIFNGLGQGVIDPAVDHGLAGAGDSTGDGAVVGVGRARGDVDGVVVFTVLSLAVGYGHGGLLADDDLSIRIGLSASPLIFCIIPDHLELDGGGGIAIVALGAIG